MNLITQTQHTLIDMMAHALFGKPYDTACVTDPSALLKEAQAQTVFLLAYSELKQVCDLSQTAGLFRRHVSNTMRVEKEHAQLHQLLSSENIAYTALKGCASAAYYPDPLLRTMGDVDFLVNEQDAARVHDLLIEQGYVAVEDPGDIHCAYHKYSGDRLQSVLELHRGIIGIPKGEAGKVLKGYLSDVIGHATLHNGAYYIPSPLHHGLILLLHTASHLTSEGVGLRHLCDWAVFAGAMDNDAFVSLFEQPLKQSGLWRFAQLLTLCAVKHLGCPPKAWAGEADNDLLDGLMTDILTGGNFGRKDDTRYRQIKYITNREDRKVEDNSLLSHMASAINQKTKSECAFVQKHPVLLPVGWVVTMTRYFGLVLTGKRKPDNTTVIQTASERKKLFAAFELFEPTKKE